MRIGGPYGRNDTGRAKARPVSLLLPKGHCRRQMTPSTPVFDLLYIEVEARIRVWFWDVVLDCVEDQYSPPIVVVLVLIPYIPLISPVVRTEDR